MKIYLSKEMQIDVVNNLKEAINYEFAINAELANTYVEYDTYNGKNDVCIIGEGKDDTKFGTAAIRSLLHREFNLVVR